MLKIKNCFDAKTLKVKKKIIFVSLFIRLDYLAKPLGKLSAEYSATDVSLDTLLLITLKCYIKM